MVIENHVSKCEWTTYRNSCKRNGVHPPHINRNHEAIRERSGSTTKAKLLQSSVMQRSLGEKNGTRPDPVKMCNNNFLLWKRPESLRTHIVSFTVMIKIISIKHVISVMKMQTKYERSQWFGSPALLYCWHKNAIS